MATSYKLSGTDNYIDASGVSYNQQKLSDYLLKRKNSADISEGAFQRQINELSTKVDDHFKNNGKSLYLNDMEVLTTNAGTNPHLHLNTSVWDTLMEHNLQLTLNGNFNETYLDDAPIRTNLSNLATAINNLWEQVKPTCVNFSLTDSFTGTRLQIRKQGGLVTLWGIVGPSKTFKMAHGTAYKIGTVPSGYRPKSRKMFNSIVLRNSGWGDIANANANVYPDGTLEIKQTSGSEKEIAQLLINMTYAIDF